MLPGSPEHPALTVEGDAVDVLLPPSLRVRATVQGPVVPGEGLPYQTESTAATFSITIERATSPLTISIDQFHAVDHLGNIYPMQLLPAEPPPPATLMPGQTMTFELRARMVTGEGVMQWAPDEKDPVATWDFVVEND